MTTTATDLTAHVTRLADTPSQMVTLESIDQSRNHRMPKPNDDIRLAELVESIRERGLLQPVRIYETSPEHQPDVDLPYILGFGWRRCQAFAALELNAIPALVYPPTSDDEIEADRAIENLQRHDIDPMEEVKAVATLLKVAGSTEFLKRHPEVEDAYDYVAGQLGKSIRWVRDRDYLHRLCPAVQQFAFDAQLPAGHLREIAKIGDQQLQLQTAIDAATDGHGWNLVDRRSTKKLKPKSEYKEFLQRTSEASYRRMTLKDVQRKVAEAQRSLRQVPWEYHLPLVDGRTTIQACANCPDNSETDRTLFGIEEDHDNPRGVCLNPKCFEDKKERTEKAKQKLARPFIRKTQKTVDTGEKPTTPPTAEIDAKRPNWLKATTARGFVQREVKKIASGQTSKTSAPSGSSSGLRQLTPYEKALQKFEAEYSKWEAAAEHAILVAARKRPMVWALLLLAAHTDAWEQQSGPDFPHISTYTKPKAEPPTAPTMKPHLDGLLDVIRAITGPDQVTAEHLLHVHRFPVQPADTSESAQHRWDRECYFIFFLDTHPTTIQEFARLTGAGIDPAPTWEQYDPNVKKQSRRRRKTTNKKAKAKA